MGKRVAKVLISSGPEKPYYIKQKGMSPAGCFLRIGSASQPMTTSMIDDLYSRRTHAMLGKIPSPRQDLTFAQLKIYYQEKGLELNERFANSLELYTPDGKYNYVAYLLADENGMSVKVAKYAGTDKVDLVQNDEYGYCSLIKATLNVLNRLNVENTTQTIITGSTRQDKRLVHPIALREAIVNAIVHNDYTREIPPVFEIFSDRMTLTSYGGLVQGQSLEDFFSFSSMPRCRELMRVFRDVGLVEQLGSGMSRILKAYDRSIFEITDHFIRVTFRYDTPQVAPQVNIESLTDNQKLAWEFCSVPRSRKQIQQQLGLEDRMHVTNTILRPLMEAELLVPTIPDKPNSSNQKYVRKG